MSVSTLDMCYRIYLMMDVLLLRFNVIHLRNISGFCRQSASRSYANAYVNVFQCLCPQRMSGMVWPMVNSTYHSSVEYSQLGHMLKSHIFLVCCHCDFFLVYNVHVRCLLTSQMLALRSSWLYVTVEWIRGVNTIRYTTLVTRSRHSHSRYECDHGIKIITSRVTFQTDRQTDRQTELRVQNGGKMNAY